MSTKNQNLVLLTGNLTRDPDVRFTQAGTAVCNCAVASNRRRKSGEEWVDDVVFIEFAIWGKSGEAFAKFFRKGQPVQLEGHLTLDQWEDKASGQKRSKLKVTVDEWYFVGRREESPASTEATPSAKPREETPF